MVEYGTFVDRNVSSVRAEKDHVEGIIRDYSLSKLLSLILSKSQKQGSCLISKAKRTLSIINLTFDFTGPDSDRVVVEIHLRK